MLNRTLLVAWTACGGLLACATHANAPQAGAAPTARSFPFVIPWDDSVKGTATDVSALNGGPAGKGGRLIVKNGKFIEEKSGKQVRLFGTNMCASAAFPTRSEADKIAARIAKLGINIVRFHHIQSDWDKEGGMIWKRGREHIELDPAQLDKLDYFIYALKKNGVYSNVNLSTTRTYQAEQGFPANIAEVARMPGFNFHKKVDIFHPRMIELQKEYAKQLLDRTNPYTKLKYKDDPAVAVVEINNENSLVGWPGESPGAGLDKLPEPYRGMLVGMWNDWLTKKYGTDAALKKAWLGAASQVGASLIGPNSKWTHENQSNASMEFQQGRSSGPGAGPIVVDIREIKGPVWHIQAHIPGLDLKDGKEYTLRFKAKSDKPRGIGLTVNLDKEDWRNCGLGATATLGPDEKEYLFSFRAHSVEPNHVRVAFVLGEAASKVEIRDVQLFPGVVSLGVPEGQSLARRNVDLVGASITQPSQDYTDFLAEVETRFVRTMTDYLRKDLGFKALITNTQMAWGGLTGLERESTSDFADAHAYWRHPVFTGGDWDPKNWYVSREAMSDLMDTSQGEFGGLSRWRVAGKPYTVSEYNHPAPNDFQAEMLPLISTFASFQDWDGYYTFDYGVSKESQANDRISGFFDSGTNPAKVAFYPSTALIFRNGLVPPATRQAILEVASKPWKDGMSAPELWAQSGKMPSLLSARTAIQKGQTDGWSVKVRGEPQKGQPLRVERNPEGVVYIADASAAKAVTGRVGGRTVACSGASFVFPKFGDNFASLTLVALDSKPLAQTKRALFTLVGRVENQNMGWNQERNSVSDNWGTGPSLAEFIPVTVQLANPAVRKVFALDGNGRRKAELKTTRQNGRLSFQVGPEAKTLWFELAEK